MLQTCYLETPTIFVYMMRQLSWGQSQEAKRLITASTVEHEKNGDDTKELIML
jgi:hypothetical protein